MDKPLKSVTHGQCDARPTVTFPVAGHRCPATGTKLYCLLTGHCVDTMTEFKLKLSCDQHLHVSINTKDSRNTVVNFTVKSTDLKYMYPRIFRKMDIMSFSENWVSSVTSLWYRVRSDSWTGPGRP